MIKATNLIVNGDYGVFMNDLNQITKEMQDNGLTVEIQYTTPANGDSFIFTALLVGKETTK